MMNGKKIEEMSGFRAPSEYERKAVSHYFQKWFQKRIKFCKRCSSVLCAIGVLNVAFYESAGILAIILALIAFGMAFICIWTKKENQEKIQVFAQGHFQILDGMVSEISVNPDSPGFSNVRFQSKYGEVLSIWCAVRQEELQIGTPLILAYVDDKTVKGGIFRAFSPYMLTEEGLKYQL